MVNRKEMRNQLLKSDMTDFKIMCSKLQEIIMRCFFMSAILAVGLATPAMAEVDKAAWDYMWEATGFTDICDITGDYDRPACSVAYYDNCVRQDSYNSMQLFKNGQDWADTCTAMTDGCDHPTLGTCANVLGVHPSAP